MGQFLDDDAFFQATPAGVVQEPLPHHRPVRIKLEPHAHHANQARTELNPLVAEQAQKVRDALQQLERQTQKMRAALEQLEQQPLEAKTKPSRRASDHEYERRRPRWSQPEDPNQLFLFDQEMLKPKFSAPPSVLPPAIDDVSIENFSISLAYGDDGMGIVGATLVALASGDSNGDGIIDSNDCYPDNSPVQRLNLDLNQLREGMMQKVRELVARFDTNGNGRIDGPMEAFAFLHHIAHLDLDVDSGHIDPTTGMITTESYIRAFGERLNRGLTELPE